MWILFAKRELLAPSEAFGLLHVLERLLVLAFLSVHAHSGDDDCRDAAGDAQPPVDAGIHALRVESVGVDFRDGKGLVRLRWSLMGLRGCVMKGE
jgi:hypothetical protein